MPMLMRKRHMWAWKWRSHRGRGFVEGVKCMDVRRVGRRDLRRSDGVDMAAGTVGIVVVTVVIAAWRRGGRTGGLMIWMFMGGVWLVPRGLVRRVLF